MYFTTIRMASLPLGGVGGGPVDLLKRMWGFTEALLGIIRSNFWD